MVFNTPEELYRQLELKHKLPYMSQEATCVLLQNYSLLVKRPLVLT